MTGRFVIGVDPGPTPGVVGLTVFSGEIIDIEVVQCSANALSSVLGALGAAAPRTLIAVERFVVRGRNNAAQSQTRDQVAQLLGFRDSVLQRSASQVKPWATDTRLEAAGLLEATKGMRHARDAARHALFCAVHDAGVPDPLSRKAHL